MNLLREELNRRDSLSHVRVFFWHKTFSDGRDNMLDLPRKPRGQSGCSPRNIRAVTELVEGDRRLSVATISSQTTSPQGTVLMLPTLKLDLLLQRKTAKFIPELLSVAQIGTRLQICTNLLQASEVEKELLSRIIIMDESWVYQYDLQLRDSQGSMTADQ